MGGRRRGSQEAYFSNGRVPEVSHKTSSQEGIGRPTRTPSLQARGEPVYQLLGGKTKPRLPVYCTTARPDVAKQLGFVGAKIPCPHGPSEGDQGLEKNVQVRLQGIGCESSYRTGLK